MMKFLLSALSLLLALALTRVAAQAEPPALPLPLIDIPDDLSPPLADGRVDVHGWLWLPTDRDEKTTPPDSPIAGWYYHHTPEFYHNSPHNFEVMTYGFLSPDTHISSLPFPPAAELVGTEYVFTPPANSLDQIIQGELSVMVGHFTNGSFDTPQYYNLSAQATLNMEYIPVVHYLDEFAPAPYPTLPYYSFPRSFSLSPPSPSPLLNVTQHFYFLHLEEQSPDFDQIVHVIISPHHCAFIPGESWEDVTMVGATFRSSIHNDVYHRLTASTDPFLLELMTPQNRDSVEHSQCKVIVLEEVHCVTVPDSFAVCPPVESR